MGLAQTPIKTVSQASSNAQVLGGKIHVSYASLLSFSSSVVSDSLWLHGLQHARLPCPSLPPGICSNSCPLNQWCYPTISSLCINSNQSINQPLNHPSSYVTTESWWRHGRQHARLPCPLPSLGVCSNSCPLNQWSVQPSHPLSTHSPPPLNLSQNQGLF